MKLYAMTYQFGSTVVVERYESEDQMNKVIRWAKSSGYAVHDLIQVESDYNQPRVEVHNLDSNTVKYFDEVGNHLL